MPTLSLVVLAWDHLPYTERCVESLRDNTDVPFELIVVDNGSEPATAARAQELGDVAVLHPENLGFAKGMNAGLAAATGDYIAFINNDTVFPSAWASRMMETLTTRRRVGIVAPAVTAAGNPVTVRSEPGDGTITLTPFGELPSGVAYIMHTGTMRQLGGWNESYPVATGEDLDLLFTMWTNGLDFVLDERVLVEHVSRGTIADKLDDPEIWRNNLKLFLERWTSPDPAVARIPSCPPEEFDRNLAHARGAAMWLRRYVELRDRQASPDDAAVASQGWLARLRRS